MRRSIGVLIALSLVFAPRLASRGHASSASRPAILIVFQGELARETNARQTLADMATRHGDVVFAEAGNQGATVGEDSLQQSRLRAKSAELAANVRSLYYAARVDDAVKVATQAVAELGDGLGYASATAELGELYLWLAVSLARAGRADDAARAMERVSDWGQALPKPGFLPPEVMTILDAGLQRAQARPRARVRMASAPAGARISVNGRVLGVAPVEVELPVGEYYVRAQRFGSQPTVRKLLLADKPGSGEVRVFEIALELATISTLAEQVAARRAHGDLDNAELVGALARLHRADEVLTVVPEHNRVRLTRWLPAWRRVASVETSLADRGSGAAVESVLWPPVAEPAPQRPIWKRWWFWTVAAGVVAAGVGAIVGVLATQKGSYVIGGAGHVMAPPPP